MPTSNNHVPGRRSFACGALLVGASLFAAVGLSVWLLKRDTAPKPVDRVAALPPPPAPLARPPKVSNDFVGSTACRECHQEIWERYKSHPMAHSLSRVLDSGGPEDYFGDREFSRGNRTYAVERVNNTVVHHERQEDQQGKVIYDQAVEVHYAIGSGTRGRSYLINRNGLLFISPISWYSQSRQWDLSPGYAEGGHPRFERRANDRCLSCHAGRVASDPEWTDRFDEQAPIVEFGISCERCHGPGGEHVDRHRATDHGPGDDPITNPARLEPTLRESVCNQCHLHGERILRSGRTDFDFRPGMHVGEIWSILVNGHPAAAPGVAGAVSQVEQMLQSTCSKRSAGRLGCISCHDPHESPPESEKMAAFREKCLACHAASDCHMSIDLRRVPPINDSCITCHMPRLTTLDIPHATQTDHRIPRRALPNHRTGEGRNEVGQPEIFDADGAPLTEIERARVRGFVLAKAAESSREPETAYRAARVLEPVAQASPDDLGAAYALAFASFVSQRGDLAIAQWTRILRISPAREEAVQMVALALELQGAREASLQYLDRLLEANPWRSRTWLKKSQVLQQLGRYNDALSASRRALELDPTFIDAYRESSDLCQRLGLTDEAASIQETVRRLTRH